MGLKTKLARGAVALSFGVMPFVFGTGVAGATESYDRSVSFDHTFTDGAGQSVTCNVSFASSISRNSSSDPFFGTAFTATGSEDACDAFVSVDVTYVDPAGKQRENFANSIAGDVLIGVDNVGSHFVVNHDVSFLNCSANCDVPFQTQPK